MAVAFVAAYTPATNPVVSGASFSVSVTVAAGDYIVLSIGVGGNATVTTAPAGGGLTYTQQVAKDPGGNIGSLYVYTAPCPSSQTFTLTGTMSAASGIGVTVARYSGVGSIGAVNGANGTPNVSSTPSMTLTTTTANPVVDVSVTDWSSTAGASTWVTTSGTPTITEDDGVAGFVADHNAYYLVTTVGSKTLGMSAPTSQVWCMGAIELVAAPKPTFVAATHPTTNPVTTTAISMSVTVVAGDFLVLAIGGGAPATVTAGPSGGGLTYTQQVAQNPGGSLPCTYIYTAPCPGSQTFTLTATMSASGPSYPVTVSRFTGVGSVGATNSAHGVSGVGGVPSMTLTTTVANSVVVASSADFTPSTGSAVWVTTSGTPTTISDALASGSSAGHDAWYAFPTLGSNTVGQSAPTGQTWTIGAIELLAPGVTGVDYTQVLADIAYTGDRLPVLPPDGLTATVVSTTEIDLTWFRLAGAISYDLERNGVVIATGLTGLSYSDTGLTSGTTYTYNIRSVY